MNSGTDFAGTDKLTSMTSGSLLIMAIGVLAAHDKVCGDFLSTEALSSLSSLGLNLPALGAVSIHNVRLAGPLGTSSTTLPFAAQSLSRRTLDEALLQPRLRPDKLAEARAIAEGRPGHVHHDDRDAGRTR